MSLTNIFRNKKRSAPVARERLRRVLSMDRVQVPPGKLHHLEVEFAQAVRKHLGIDPADVQVEVSGQGRDVQLSARVFLRRPAA